MDSLAFDVLVKIFLKVPPSEVQTLSNVSTTWRSIVDQNIGIAMAIASPSDVPVDLENRFRPITDVMNFGISDCRIGLLAEDVILPEFKYPHLLMKLSLDGEMSSANFKSSIRFERLRVLKLSVETMLSLKIADVELALPELQWLKVFLRDDDNQYLASEDSAKRLVANVTTLLEQKRFEMLKRIDLHFFCFMSGLDADIRSGLFQFLLNHKDSLTSVLVKLRFVDDVTEEEGVIEDLCGAISRQPIQFIEDTIPPALKSFRLVFESLPLNENDYFGLQSKTWGGLVSRLNSLETYELDCLDEDWEDTCIFEDEIPNEYIPKKPTLPNELILRNALTLRKLSLSLKTWDDQNDMVETLDFQVFETCVSLEELILVGQWKEDFIRFVDPIDVVQFPVIENLHNLPQSLRILKTSFILFLTTDVQDLIDKNFQELHLKYFGPHGSCHTVGEESLSVTSFIGNFNNVPFLTNTIDRSGQKLAELHLIASDYLAREGDHRTTLLDAYRLRNCVNLKEFSLEGMDFEHHFNLFDKSSGKDDVVLLRQVVIPGGIIDIRYFPKSVASIKLKNVFVKFHHMHFFLKEMENLRILELEDIGQFKNCGVTPQAIHELCQRKRIRRLSVTNGLNWTTWQGLGEAVGSVGLKETYPLLRSIMKRLGKRLCLELNQNGLSYDASFD